MWNKSKQKIEETFKITGLGNIMRIPILLNSGKIPNYILFSFDPSNPPETAIHLYNKYLLRANTQLDYGEYKVAMEFIFYQSTQVY